MWADKLACLIKIRDATRLQTLTSDFEKFTSSFYLVYSEGLDLNDDFHNVRRIHDFVFILSN